MMTEYYCGKGWSRTGVKYDVIVAGSGPAGSSAAYRLAAAGRKVLVLEKEAFPRYKPCGGAVSQKALPILDFDWQGVVESASRTVIFSYRRERQVRVELEKPLVYLVMRDRFDALLADRARGAGAEIKFGLPVENVRVDRGEVTVTTGDGREYRASYLLGADGAASRVARSLGLMKGSIFGAAVAVELDFDDKERAIFEGAIRTDCGAAPWGYGWVFPKSGGVTAGVGTTSRGLDINKYTLEFLAREGLSTGRVTCWKGHLLPADGGKKKDITSHRVMLMGDAAGLVDPLSGEGIYYALKSGEIAAGAIIRNDSPEKVRSFYQEAVFSEILPELSAAGRLASMVFRFGRILFDLTDISTRIAVNFCRVTSGESSYRFNDGRKLYSLIREAAAR